VHRQLEDLYPDLVGTRRQRIAQCGIT
jgi:hypothetical protein